MNRLLGFVLIAFCLLAVSSCAPSGITFEEYGFWHGLWHGFSSIFSLIGTWFGADIGIYAENNTGFFYWAGYVIGVFFLLAMTTPLTPLNLIILILLILAAFDVV